MVKLVEYIRNKYDADDEDYGMIIQCKPRLDQLRVVSVSGTKMTEVGDDVGSVCPSIQEIDLAGTWITDWNEIIKLCSQLPKLGYIDLRSLKFDTSTIQFNGDEFSNIESLIITGTNIPPEFLHILSQTFPGLRNLVADKNSYQNLDDVFISGFQNLVQLNLSSNELQWDQILPIAGLPQLRTLKIVHNPIDVIWVPEGFEGFKSLVLLNLENTAIDNWNDIWALGQMGIKELRIGGIPLGARFGDMFRNMVVSYMQSLDKLNGGDSIPSNDRKTCERAFIREFRDNENCAVQWTSEQAESEGTSLTKLTPEEQALNAQVYATCFEKWGEVFKFAEVDMAPPTEATLKLHTDEGREAMETVLLSWTVKDLAKLIKSLFGIPLNQMTLYYEDQDLAESHANFEHMRTGSRTLASYRMKDGDGILIAAQVDAKITFVEKPQTSTFQKESNINHFPSY